MNIGLNAVTTGSRNVAHKAGKFLENKTEDAAMKSDDDKILKTDESPRNFEEIIIPSEKEDEILNKLRAVL